MRKKTDSILEGLNLLREAKNNDFTLGDSFEYGGYTFYPLMNHGMNFNEASRKISNDSKIKVSNYKHEEFYKVAKKAHANVDLFGVNGEVVIPVSYGFQRFDSPKAEALYKEILNDKSIDKDLEDVWDKREYKA